MTLAELLPSLRIALRPTLDPRIWPATARWASHGDLTVGGVRASELAQAYGTPVQVLDEGDVRRRSGEYRAAFGPDAVAYAAKGGLVPQVAEWLAREGLGCYAGSAEALRTAVAAGIGPDRLVLSGCHKSVSDLEEAIACGAAIVVGSIEEVEAVAARASTPQRVLIRVLPAAAARSRKTYGVRLGTSPAFAMVEAVRRSPNLVLAGLDCALGHQLSRFGAYEACLREAVAFCAVLRSRRRIVVPMINLGGGHAVAYQPGDDELAVEAFAKRLRAVSRVTAERYGIATPRLRVSPGRALLARAGITLHRVTEAARLVVVLDGAVPDCLPGAECTGRHAIELIGRVSSAPMQSFTVVCGAGRPVAAQLPADVATGDLVAIAGTGAYHQRAEHFVGRPAVVGVSGGQSRTLVRRDTVDDLLNEQI
ncbi:diaminopimelate decarboxylase family protein [Actinoplanes solisilvae]|uniref:diaminopimelate decarboxylase family protein n=1 Tax=Actinoplanes solisilvae TaxID=2486853 RepID=UPI000FDA2FC3|nr:diaminopimelate decarboxylase [Actinoplanes solisilvae]